MKRKVPGPLPNIIFLTFSLKVPLNTSYSEPKLNETSAGRVGKNGIGKRKSTKNRDKAKTSIRATGKPNFISSSVLQVAKNKAVRTPSKRTSQATWKLINVTRASKIRADNPDTILFFFEKKKVKAKAKGKRAAENIATALKFPIRERGLRLKIVTSKILKREKAPTKAPERIIEKIKLKYSFLFSKL